MRLALLFSLILCGAVVSAPTEQQLANWLKRFPDADTNKDGRLTAQEAQAYRNKLRAKQPLDQKRSRRGAPREFKVHEGWERDRFPEHAVCYRAPAEIKALYAKSLRGRQKVVTSLEKPSDGALRIVGTGHSFMAPGYKTFPRICRAAGFEQPLLTHTGGGITGSARYKWEQENGIFQFDGNPRPKLLASISNAQWDAMMWGPYYQDRPAYYTCWIDFCLKYNPHMKFYLSDAWPQLRQLDSIPKTEDSLTAETFVRLGKEKHAGYEKLMAKLNAEYPGKVFVMPTSAAMVLAVQHYHRGELPGVEGINRSVGRKERSLWRDQLGHLGPGFDRLEGYVFYATIYGHSPERIEGDVFDQRSTFPSRKLDGIFRKIAWQAVTGNLLSGVVDKNRNGIGDDRE